MVVLYVFCAKGCEGVGYNNRRVGVRVRLGPRQFKDRCYQSGQLWKEASDSLTRGDCTLSFIVAMILAVCVD